MKTKHCYRCGNKIEHSGVYCQPCQESFQTRQMETEMAG
jgi:predicted nucleic acid-binding Zn ribbon protein